MTKQQANSLHALADSLRDNADTLRNLIEDSIMLSTRPPLRLRVTITGSGQQIGEYLSGEQLEKIQKATLDVLAEKMEGTIAGLYIVIKDIQLVYEGGERDRPNSYKGIQGLRDD